MASAGLAPIFRRLGRVLLDVLMAGVALWSLGAIRFCMAPPALLGISTAVVLLALYVGVRVRGGRSVVARYTLVLFACGITMLWMRIPQSDASWQALHEHLAVCRVHGERLEIDKFRDARHFPDRPSELRWQRRVFTLEKLRQVDFIVVPFQDFDLGAHTFVSFGFEGGDWLAISIEARLEEGESYGLVRGLYRQFELLYVVGSERDLIGLRSHIRGDEVYIYPMRASPAEQRAFLLTLLEAANAIRERPQFYHSIWSNCTSLLRTQLGIAMQKAMPWTYEVLLPALSDALVHREGWVDTDLPLERARARFRVPTASFSLSAPDFSARARGGRRPGQRAK